VTRIIMAAPVVPVAMRATLLLLLVLGAVLLPSLAAAEDPPNPRPLCDGEPLVDLRECYDGYAVHTCKSDDRLHGLGCFVLG
jgi:hypothetical protein